MKKYLILSLALFVVVCTYAQKSKVNSASTKITPFTLPGMKVDPAIVADAKADIDAALQDDYTKTWVKTYIVASQVYAVNYKVTKDPKDLIQANQYLLDAQDWNKKGDAKGKGKGKSNDDIKTAIKDLKNNVINGGVEAYNDKDFGDAATLFGMSSEMEHGDLFAGDNIPVDTAIIFNAAIAASNAKQHEAAIKYYKEVTKYGYEGVTPYLYMSGEYLALNDTVGLIAATKEGLAKYPNSDGGLLMQLINIYLAQQDLTSAYEYLGKAIEADPSNATLYFAKGVIEEQKGNPKAAEDCYRKAIEINPKSADSYYNLGVLEFNKGVEIFNNARDIKDNKAYDAEIAKAKDQFKVALDPFNKAVEIDPTKREYLVSLKQLYYRLGDQENQDKIDAKINAL